MTFPISVFFFFISIFKICIWKLKIEVSRSDSARFFLFLKQKQKPIFVSIFRLKKKSFKKNKEKEWFLFSSITLPWRIGIFFFPLTHYISYFAFLFSLLPKSLSITCEFWKMKIFRKHLCQSYMRGRQWKRNQSGENLRVCI